MKGKTFVLVGSAGYIAPRHIRAIKELEGKLVGCIDISFTKEALDVLPKGILTADSIEEFSKQYAHKIDYLVVCSPNFLHEEHIIQGLKRDMTVISEKPLALTSEGLQRLEEAENASEGKIYSILQLRLHPVVLELEELVKQLNHPNHEIKITYIAKRDPEYFTSWKGNLSLSGGLLLNVGVHYFDLLLNIFGSSRNINLQDHSNKRSKGSLSLEKGSVDWLFSFKTEDVDEYVLPGQFAFRSITVDGKEIEFSQVAEDLHTQSYRKISQGEGFSLQEARKSIELVDKINNTKND
jgi:UDP-N-acetyl-2-amino-2-deoxyglucuronate dehydrogenase